MQLKSPINRAGSLFVSESIISLISNALFCRANSPLWSKCVLKTKRTLLVDLSFNLTHVQILVIAASQLLVPAWLGNSLNQKLPCVICSNLSGLKKIVLCSPLRLPLFRPTPT